MIFNTFIDSDVIQDFYLDRKPFSDHAEVLFSLGLVNRIKLNTTPLVVSNVHYILSKENSKNEVLEK